MARSSSNRLISSETPPLTASEVSAPTTAPTGPERIVPRIIWMAAGPAFILLSAAVIAKARVTQLGLMDLLLWFAAGATVLMRWLDIRLWNGTTAEHEPATMKDWRAYALRIVVMTLVAWALSHSVHQIV